LQSITGYSFLYLSRFSRTQQLRCRCHSFRDTRCARRCLRTAPLYSSSDFATWSSACRAGAGSSFFVVGLLSSEDLPSY
jgi:hypothetical protein